MILDAHCHYNLEPLSANWGQHWQHAQEKGVGKSIVVGTNVETSHLAINIAHQQQHLWATVAIHPIEYNRLSEEELRTEKLLEKFQAELETLLADTKTSKVV